MRVVALRIRRIKGKPFWVLLLFSLFIFFLSRSVHNYQDQLLSVHLSAPKFAGLVSIQETDELREIEFQLAKARPIQDTQKVKGTYKLTMLRRNSRQIYLFDQPGILLNPRTGSRLALGDGGQCLKDALTRLNDKNPYGEFLTWEEAGEIFRKYDKARVRDLETGMSFTVQRRAGSNHADVQPLTAADSAVMKTIYNGRWSWRRRAIVVELKGRRIAASMNGMPHGAGAITNNDFDGHFCIHFRDSKTHSNAQNLSHQMMVWKAANMVEEMLRTESPDQTARVFLEAVAQGDAGLAGRFVKITGKSSNEKVKRLLESINWVALSEIKLNGDVKDRADVNVVVSFGLKGGTQVNNKKVTLKMVKDSPDSLWQIPEGMLTALFEPKANDTIDTPNESVYQDWKVDLQT